MEKKTYWVPVQAPVFKKLGYFLKAANAPSMERAREIVARYCDYHNKRRGFSGDKIFRVVPTPTSYAIKILYNPDSNSLDLLNELFDKLGKIKSAYATFAHYRYKVNVLDNSTQALFFLDGDVTLKEMFAEVIEPYKTSGVFIDYIIETCPYDASNGMKVKNFLSFK
nr:MAG TPA: hypothetical protein [Caudoviricetes sp.]